MDFWLQRFIVEARRKDGVEYPPKSLYLITCGLLRYLRDADVNDKNFLDEQNLNFCKFRKVLDARMKMLIEKGIRCEIKQAEPITQEQEESMWRENVFGKESAEMLQRTMFFYSAKLFGLRACDEHHDLQCSQFVVGDENGTPFVQFIGRQSKTFKGGLGHMNITNKNIKHYCKQGNIMLFHQ
ncbi:unnamed protein product [Mytilus coruscus]|uniref:Uncharacterized protein n=1 Tax=Mytilus coruscus TaxID=42192 RepID=A0A6J8E8R5_MYTCO|nr:unnamed protein product [Mytilus coruscus]